MNYFNLKKKLTILGIDPGSKITGYGIIQNNSSHISHIKNGDIKTDKSDFPIKLKIIYDNLMKIIRTFSPNIIAIEQIFVSKNIDSAIKLSQVYGIISLAAANNYIPIFKYSTKKIKKFVTGTGNSDKYKTKEMVTSLLNLKNISSIDAADALATAITCYLENQTTFCKIRNSK